MYSEIYDGLMDILNPDPSEKTLSEMKDFGHVPHYLNLTFGYDPAKIKRVKRVKIPGYADILFVLAFSPDNRRTGQYVDYVIMDGIVSKMIVINMNNLTSDNLNDQAYMITFATYNACIGVAEAYKNIFDDESGKYSLGSQIYYAPAVLIVQLFRKLYKDLSDDELYAITIAALSTYSRIKVTYETVDSIRRAIDDSSLSLLLDSSLFLSLDEDVYPKARFADNDDIESDKEEEQEDE